MSADAAAVARETQVSSTPAVMEGPGLGFVQPLGQAGVALATETLGGATSIVRTVSALLAAPGTGPVIVLFGGGLLVAALLAGKRKR